MLMWSSAGYITYTGRIANWKSPHNWLVLLAIDLATFCNTWSSKGSFDLVSV